MVGFFAIFKKISNRVSDVPQGNSNLGELLTDIPTVSTDLTSISAITRNSIIAFYAIYFSVLKACSYWNSDTLAAIVEHGCTFYNTIKCRKNCNELPQKLDIYGACINANIVFKSEGTFSYFEKNILKRHKSLQQKTRITTKRRNCYAQLGFLKRKKCLDNFQQYYKDNRLHIRSVSAQKYKSMDQDEKDNLLGKYKEKYKSKDPDEKQNLLAKCKEKYQSMDADEKQNLLAKCKEKYQSMDADEKHNLLAKCKEKYQSMDKDQKHNFLGACKEKYISMDAARKQTLLTACADKYKAMDEIKKQNLLTVCAEKYKAMDPNKKQVQCAKPQKSHISRPGLPFSETNTRDTTLLAKIYV